MLALAFAADGKSLATAGMLQGGRFGAGRLPDLPQVRFPGVPVLPGGNANASRRAGQSGPWNLPDGRWNSTRRHHTGNFLSGGHHRGIFAPDGTRLAVALGQEVRLLPLNGGESTTLIQVARTAGFDVPRQVHALAFSPDGLHLAVGGLRRSPTSYASRTR